MDYEQLVSPNLNQTAKAGLCLYFSRSSYGAPAVEASAWEGWLNTKFKHADRNLPNVSVPLWFQHYGSYGEPAVYKNWGHVADYIPGRGILTSPITLVGPGQQWYESIDALVNDMNRVAKGSNTVYVGWSEDISNVRVAKEKQEVIELQPPVFNEAYYYQANPDVAKAGVKAADHWLRDGMKEGRKSAPNFSVQEYVNNYSDLKTVIGSNWQSGVQHYFNYGINEGRFGTKALFDAAQESTTLQTEVATLKSELDAAKKAAGSFTDADRITLNETNSLIKKIVEWFKSIFKVS